MHIDIPKELDFYVDFEYISFIKFSSTHPKIASLRKFALFKKKRNFEISILFNIAEKSNNYVFQDGKIPPQSLREELQVMNFAHYLHIVLVIAKYTDMFRRDFSGGRVTWEDLFIGKRISMKGRWFFQHYLKNNQKLNKKKKHVFSTENKEQH